MPTLTLDKKEFDRMLGKKLPDDVLKDRISMIGTDLEKLDDTEIVVEVFPNRPDMLSMQGFVRAMAAYMDIRPGLSEFIVKKSGEKVIIDASVSKCRPYTACAIVKNLKLNDEKIKDMIQVQEKLHVTFGRNRRKLAIGIYPMEKIKLPITFFAEDPKKIKFWPLEAEGEMTGLQILTKHPTGREYAHLLEGYDKFPFFKDANGKILSMPPIINSHDTGKVGFETKEVFIECSGFDFNVLQKCLNMIVTAFSDMGGEIYSMELQYPDKNYVTPNLSPDKMKLDIDYINKCLGLKLKEADIKKLLRKMGMDVVAGEALVPAYRADLMHQVDLVEDIAVAYGFENFVEEIPNVATTGHESRMSVFIKRVANILTGLGLLELNTYNLTNKTVQNDKTQSTGELVELESSVSGDYTHLRRWMLPTLLEVFQNNKHNEYPQKVFDAGTVFLMDPKSEMGVEERQRLGVAVSEGSANYTSIRQALDYLLLNLGIDKEKIEIKEMEHPSFIPGRVGKILIGKKEVGYIGEVHPQVLANFQLDMPVGAFELDLDIVSELVR
jgi:phenylalanyl-tRNA synthetase beta chain